MTALDEHDKTHHDHPPTQTLSKKVEPTVGAKEDAQELLGVLLLLQKTWMIAWELRVAVYGYAAWLLFPIVLGIFAQGLPSPYGNYLFTARDLLSFMLNLWVTCVIVIFVTDLLLKKIKGPDDYIPIGKKAWDKVIKLFIVQTISSLLIAAGSIIFAIPGIVAWVWTVFAIPDAILNDGSIWQSFKRSRDLARGRFFPILGRLLVANGLFALVAGVLFTGYLLAGLHGSTNSVLATLQAWPDWLQTGLSLILVVITPMVTIFHLVLYIAAETTYPNPDKDHAASGY